MLHSYRDLIVWQKTIVLVKEIYLLQACFPKEERYALSDQMRRSAISIAANIAEGKMRQHRREYIQFLYIAFGSAAELDTHLLIAKEVGYLSQTVYQKCEKDLNEILRMLNALTRKLREQE